MTCQELPDRDYCPFEADYPVVHEDLVRHFEEARRQQAETATAHQRLAAAFVVSYCVLYGPGREADV